MFRLFLSLTAVATLSAGAFASPITGQYIEARTCDVYTGACFANADTGLAGKNGVLAWRIERGDFNQVRLDGLSIVAVLAASDTLGLRQNGATKSIVIVDRRANSAQREALIAFAKQQAGKLLDNVVAVRASDVDLEICPCKGNACAKLKAGDVTIETRCIDPNHDRGCGVDCAFYPPLIKGITAKPAYAVEHTFSGKDFNVTWNDAERRGSYVGTFRVE